MSNQNKAVVIGTSVAVGCVIIVTLGIGWMQFVSFRNEQKLVAEREALEDVSAECRDLSRLVNRAQDFMPAFEAEIQTFSNNAAQVKSLADIKAAASQYTDAVDAVVGDLNFLLVDLRETELNNEQLLGYRNRYIDMVAGFSDALSQASDAMSLIQQAETAAELPPKIEESQQQTVQAVQRIEDLSNQEKTIISDVNSFCEETNIQKLELQTGN